MEARHKMNTMWPMCPIIIPSERKRHKMNTVESKSSLMRCIVGVVVPLIISVVVLCAIFVLMFVLEKGRGGNKVKSFTVEEYAVKLRKDFNSVHIYEREGRFEVWYFETGKPCRWSDSGTIEEARKIVDDYYIAWAKNCVEPSLSRKLVE